MPSATCANNVRPRALRAGVLAHSSVNTKAAVDPSGPFALVRGLGCLGLTGAHLHIRVDETLQLVATKLSTRTAMLSHVHKPEAGTSCRYTRIILVLAPVEMWELEVWGLIHRAMIHVMLY
jgi:hypothetical protein